MVQRIHRLCVMVSIRDRLRECAHKTDSICRSWSLAGASSQSEFKSECLQTDPGQRSASRGSMSEALQRELSSSSPG